MVLNEWTSLCKNHKYGYTPYILHKSQLKMDYELTCKIWKLLEDAIGKHLNVLGYSANFLDTRTKDLISWTWLKYSALQRQVTD
jgi:hypothetical protein